MHTLTAEIFDRITSIDDGHVVTIHVPTERAGRETEKARIHLKNGIGQARMMLDIRGVEKREIDRRMKPLEALTDDHEFWQKQHDGLAVFQHGDEHTAVSIDTTPDPLVHVGQTPHIVPLVPRLGALQPFAVLALSSNRIAMFRVQGESIEMMDVPDLPEAYKDLGKYIDEESQLQFHTADTRGAAGSTDEAIYHGHGVGTESLKKTRLAEFSRMIDKSVVNYLRNGPALPLMVIAAEPFHTIYRGANSYDRLIENDAQGNIDHLSERQILRVARKIASSTIGNTESDVLADMKERLGSDGVLYELEDVLEAAADGKLERLIGASDRQVWGKADLGHSPRAVDAHKERQNGDEDLHNLAFVTAHRTGAGVYAIPEEQMPEGRTLLGLRRY